MRAPFRANKTGITPGSSPCKTHSLPRVHRNRHIMCVCVCVRVSIQYVNAMRSPAPDNDFITLWHSRSEQVILTHTERETPRFTFVRRRIVRVCMLLACMCVSIDCLYLCLVKHDPLLLHQHTHTHTNTQCLYCFIRNTMDGIDAWLI